jgi:hypothetical protein
MNPPCRPYIYILILDYTSGPFPAARRVTSVVFGVRRELLSCFRPATTQVKFSSDVLPGTNRAEISALEHEWSIGNGANVHYGLPMPAGFELVFLADPREPELIIFFRRVVGIQAASADGRLSTPESIELCRTVQAIILNCLARSKDRMYFLRAAAPRVALTPLPPHFHVFAIAKT